MIFSRTEYKYEVELIPKNKITNIKKKPIRQNRSIWLHPYPEKKFTVTMYICPIFARFTCFIKFRLVAGPEPNSVIVFKYTKSTSAALQNYPYELIENISKEYINTELRINRDNRL